MRPAGRRRCRPRSRRRRGRRPRRRRGRARTRRRRRLTATSSPRRTCALVITRPSAITTPEPRPQPRPSPMTAGPTRSAAAVTAACSSSRKPVISACPFSKWSTAGRPRRPPRPGRPPAVLPPRPSSAGSKSSDLQLASHTVPRAHGGSLWVHGPPPPCPRAALAAGGRARPRGRPLDAARGRRAARGGEALQRAAGRARRYRAERAERRGSSCSASRRSSSSRPYSDRPPRFVYELTESGRELAGALRLLADWGARTATDAQPLRHAACGSVLEAAGGARAARRSWTTPPTRATSSTSEGFAASSRAGCPDPRRCRPASRR